MNKLYSQVGACIVNKENIIVSTGYNGMPYGCDDDVMPWGKSDDTVTDKHSYGKLHISDRKTLNFTFYFIYHYIVTYFSVLQKKCKKNTFLF